MSMAVSNGGILYKQIGTGHHTFTFGFLQDITFRMDNGISDPNCRSIVGAHLSIWRKKAVLLPLILFLNMQSSRVCVVYLDLTGHAALAPVEDIEPPSGAGNGSRFPVSV
jgi:hypothetical protein